MPNFGQALLYAFAVGGLVCFVVYGFDKFKAKTGGRRVSEKALLMFSFMGPLGAMMGILLFQHKVSKGSFKMKLIPVLVFSLGLWGWAFYQVS